MNRTRTERIQIGGAEGIAYHLDALNVRVVRGPDRDLQARFPLPIVRIGSGDDNDLVLSDPKVSRAHAEVRLRDGVIRVRDLGSTNGTFVGDVKVTEAELRPGQICRVGESELRIEERREARQALLDEGDRLGRIVGRSEPMRELFGILRAVATLPASVLVLGESGTGKEGVARTLHDLSGREGPLVVFDAAATDPSMIRSDLFGHEKGAYTGAERDRQGAFRRADGGTLFIDEVGELPLDLQPRLLRALESREVQALGADEPVRVDVRVVAATHRDLPEMVAAGRFREDLMHRLSVVPIWVPALRERPEDVPLLVEHFKQELSLNLHLEDAALPVLAAHPWPGNVRALRNHLERLAALSGGKPLGPDDLRLDQQLPTRRAPTLGADPDRVRVELALRNCRGNKSQAARELGMSLSTLKRRLKEYGLS